MDQLLQAYLDLKLDPDSGSTDTDADGNVPPTTRWNRRKKSYRTQESHNQVDPNQIVRSAATPESDQRALRRQWHARVVRSMGSRSICWSGSDPYESLSGSELQRKFCFVCRLQLETEPDDRKSFPLREWVRAANGGCPNCREVVSGVELASEAFGLDVTVLQLATIFFFNLREWARSSEDLETRVESFIIALFWVDAVGDRSEHLQFDRKGKPCIEPAVSDAVQKTQSLVVEEYQLQCFQKARDLLQKCDREHSCQRSSEFLPTRLIDIHGNSSDSPVKMIQSSSVRPSSAVRYAAFSYCWGKFLPLRLLQSTVEKMEAGIAWDELPQLFQDVVTFTRSLGLRYIWIDALCIVQDDRDDWERESAQMGGIYYYSYVTIGATSSEDTTRSLTATPFQNIHLEVQSDSKSYASVETRTLGGDLTWPLHHRGWAYQEILLPARYLDFDSNALSLHCCQGTTRVTDEPSLFDLTISSDHYYREWGNHIGQQNFRQPWAFRWFWARILSGANEDTKGQRIELWQAWQEVVMMYTNRRLTYASDRLPAIGGLAAEYLRRSEPGEEYCAGIWKSSFIEHLAWKTYFHNEVPINDYQAPSWSWASVSDIIDYDTQNYRYEDRKQVYAKMMEVSVTTKRSNPFGAVTGGYVRLAGPWMWCRMERCDDDRAGDNSPRRFSLKGIDFYVSKTFLADTELERTEVDLGDEGIVLSAKRVESSLVSSSPARRPVEACHVILLPLFGDSWGSTRTCLVLSVVDVDEQEYIFQRIGLVSPYFVTSDEKNWRPVEDFKII